MGANSNFRQTLNTSMAPKQDENDLGLPSYTDALSASRSESGKSAQSSIQTQVHDELLNIAIQYNNTRGHKVQQLQQQDQKILDLLLPCIQDFLTACSESALPRATLIIIPAGVIPEEAVSCDDDLQAVDDFSRLVRLSTERKDGSQVWSTLDTVERLAAQLQPRAKKQAESVTAPKSPPAEASSAKKWLWNRRASVDKTSPAPMYADGMASLPQVTMRVTAEDIEFRVENDMGLWETRELPGLAIRIHINTNTRLG